MKIVAEASSLLVTAIRK